MWDDVCEGEQAITRPRSCTFPSRSSSTLHTAIVAGNLHLVKDLVRDGVDVNEEDVHGWSPLQVAIREGHLDIAAFLVNCGGKDSFEKWKEEYTRRLESVLHARKRSLTM